MDSVEDAVEEDTAGKDITDIQLLKLFVRNKQWSDLKSQQ